MTVNYQGGQNFWAVCPPRQSDSSSGVRIPMENNLAKKDAFWFFIHWPLLLQLILSNTGKPEIVNKR
jgi:hypothetical protein